MNKKNIILISLLFAVFLSEALAYKPPANPYKACQRLIESLIFNIEAEEFEEEAPKFPPDFLRCDPNTGEIPIEVLVELALFKDLNSIPEYLKDCRYAVAPWALSGNGVLADIYCLKHGFLKDIQNDSNGNFIEPAEYMQKRCQEEGINLLIAKQMSAQFNPDPKNRARFTLLERGILELKDKIGDIGFVVLHFLAALLLCFLLYRCKLIKRFALGNFIMLLSGIFIALEILYLPACKYFLIHRRNPYCFELFTWVKIIPFCHWPLFLICPLILIKQWLNKKPLMPVTALFLSAILGVYWVNILSCLIAFWVVIKVLSEKEVANLEE